MTKKQDPKGQLLAALVLVDTRLAGLACPVGSVLQGLPAQVADQYSGALDPHPDAVAHAMDNGAQVLQYPEPETKD